MRRTAILMLVLAAALGGGAVYLARGWLQEQIRTAAVVPQQPQVSLTTVVVAKRPLKFGDRVTREVLSETKWPANTVPTGSFNTINSILGDGKRRVALREIKVNEPVLKDRISGFGGRATLSTVIEKGLRAVTIRVNDVNGVAGFVLPGDRVDILLTRDWSGKTRGANKITNVLMQNIKVLGIDQLADNEKDKPKVARSVTMEVTIDQSQKLALAAQVGSLSLTLRNMTNTDPTTHRMVRVRDLVDDNLVKKTAPPKVAKSKAPKKTRRASAQKVNPYANVKVVRGTRASVQEVVSEKAPERGTIRTYPAPTMMPDATSPPPPAIGQTVDAPAMEPRQATSAPIRLTPDSTVSADRQPEADSAKSVEMPLAKADESRQGTTGAARQ